MSPQRFRAGRTMTGTESHPLSNRIVFEQGPTKRPMLYFFRFGTDGRRRGESTRRVHSEQPVATWSLWTARLRLPETNGGRG